MIDSDGRDLNDVFDAMRRFQASIAGDSMEFWLECRLSPPQLAALHLIRRDERLSGRQLARALEVSPGAVVALCDRLQERGFVERVQDDVDRRITWFQLTDAGERLFTRMQELSRRAITPALRALSPRDRGHLIRILDHLTTSVDRRRQAEEPHHSRR
jgi:DNA-binding MarR family transcriptional regulator